MLFKITALDPTQENNGLIAQASRLQSLLRTVKLDI
jgi:hypothetical protein